MSSSESNESQPSPNRGSIIGTSLANSVSTHGVFDAQQFVNMAMSAYIMNMVSHLKTATLTPKLLGVFLILISLNEIKGGLIDFAKTSKQQIPRLLLIMLKYFTGLLRMLNPLTPLKLGGGLLLTWSKEIVKRRQRAIEHKRMEEIERRQEQERKREQGITIPLSHTIIVKMDPNHFNVTSIHMWCQQNIIGKHQNSYRYTSKSITDHQFQIEYNNLLFPIGEECQAHLLNNLNVTYDIENNVKSFHLGKAKVSNLRNVNWSSHPWVESINKTSLQEKVLKYLEDWSINMEIGPKLLRDYETVEKDTLRKDYRNLTTFQPYEEEKTYRFCDLLLFYTQEHFSVFRSDYGIGTERGPREVQKVYLIIIALSKVLQEEYGTRNFRLYTNESRDRIGIYDYFDMAVYRRRQGILSVYDYTFSKFDRQYLSLDNFRVEDYLTPIPECNKELQFEVTGPCNDKDESSKKVYEQFTKFFQKTILSSNEKKENSQITVYAINFNKIEIPKEIDNPEYLEWQEKVDLIKKASQPKNPPKKHKKKGAKGEDNDKKKSDSDTESDEPKEKGEAESDKEKETHDHRFQTPYNQFPTPGLNYVTPVPSYGAAALTYGGTYGHGYGYENSQLTQLYMNMPKKKIMTTEINYELDCRVINKVYKRLETLYIREHDKDVLSAMLEKFKNKRDLYYELGIPYKLGLLFHGRPGTGKTSAIKAVASYLNKDIYFVHMKNIKTNRDLKEIFEHINHKCNGGVVVLEDIDAATDVVFQRDSDAPTKAKTVTDSLESDEDALTLSYLLNMLDGTLCSDGTIFAITTNHIEKLDKALYRKGRVDVNIEFKCCDHFQIKEIYQAILGRTVPPELLERIPENVYPPCDFIFHVYQYLLNDKFTDETILQPFLLDTIIDK